MHRRRIIPLLATVCLMLVLAACGKEEIDDPVIGSGGGTPTTEASPTSETSPTPIASPTLATSISIDDLTTLDWQLIEIDGAPVIDGSIVTMVFIPDNRSLVNGFADCHAYFAGIEWDETGVRLRESGPFPGLDQRERVCQHPDAGPEQDAAFFTALTEMASYHASDERLTFFDGDDQPRLSFVPRAPVTVDPALTGTTWLLTDLNEASPVPGTMITLMFDESSASGNDGCNGFGAQLLAASDGRLVFGNGAEDQAACVTPEGVMEQSDRFSEAFLTNTVGYRVDGTQLELLDHDGNTLLRFAPQEAAADFDPALAAHRWGLIEANGQPAIPGSLVTLELAEDSISGSDGCNFYGGELLYAIDGALEVATEYFTQTDAGCRTDDLLPQAELFTTTLAKATTYQIDGDRLTIGNAAGITLVFGPQAEVLLIGNTWSLPGMTTVEPNGEVRWDALVEGTKITLTVNEDGTLAGNASCNTYGGSYTIDGASITISDLYWTEMACPDPPGIMEQEMTYLDTLQAVTTWEIGMNGLTLTTDDGRLLGELSSGS